MFLIRIPERFHQRKANDPQKMETHHSIENSHFFNSFQYSMSNIFLSTGNMIYISLPHAYV